MMQEIRLKRLTNGLDKLLEQFPDRRRELHERIGKAVQHKVRESIDTAGAKDSGGQIKETTQRAEGIAIAEAEAWVEEVVKEWEGVF